MKITYLLSKVFKDFIPKKVKNIASQNGYEKVDLRKKLGGNKDFFDEYLYVGDKKFYARVVGKI